MQIENSILVTEWFTILPWLHQYFKTYASGIDKISANELDANILQHEWRVLSDISLIFLFAKNGKLLGQVGAMPIPRKEIVKSFLFCKWKVVVDEHQKCFDERIGDAIKRCGAENELRFVIGTIRDWQSARFIISTFPEEYTYLQWRTELRKRLIQNRKEMEIEAGKQIRSKLQQLGVTIPQ